MKHLFICFKKESKKGEAFLGLLFCFVFFQKSVCDSATGLGNGTNAHSKMLLWGFSADRACRKLVG